MAAKNIETPEDRIQRIKRLYNSKKPEIEKPWPSFEEFLEWHEKQPQKCCYCGISEPELARLIDSGRLFSKRLPTRGRHLELERKIPDLPYDKFDNLALACYWCNNAKTDSFTADEFKEVGRVFHRIWQDRLTNNNPAKA